MRADPLVNFDGVHRGHQALLQGLRKEGEARGLPVVVMIFEPQPLELFAGDKSPARLTRLREEVALPCRVRGGLRIVRAFRSPLCRAHSTKFRQ